MEHDTELKLSGDLNHRECATVLAALRRFQYDLQGKERSVRGLEFPVDPRDMEHFEDDEDTTPLTATTYFTHKTGGAE